MESQYFSVVLGGLSMRNRVLLAATALATALLAIAAVSASGQSGSSTASAKSPDLSAIPLIPRATLFGNPVRAAGQIRLTESSSPSSPRVMA
jgi:hypothetical protein